MDKESRKGIVVGLVSSTLFLVIVQPSLSIGWKWLTNTGSAFSDYLSNRLYQAAALGPRNWVVVDLATFGFALFLGFYVSVFVVMLTSFKRLRKDLIESRDHSRRTIQDRLSDHERRMRRLFTAYPLMIVVIAVLGGFTVFRYSADLKLNTSFSHRLTLLSPKMSEKDVDQLRADWAAMKSRKDYEAIVQRMDAIAKSASIELPPHAMR